MPLFLIAFSTPLLFETLKPFWALIVWQVISAFINLAFYKRTATEWEAWALKKPGFALFVELCRANGWDVAKNIRLFQRFGDRQFGQMPAVDLDRLPIPPLLKRAILDPALCATLEELLTEHAKGRGPLSSPEAPRETAVPPPPTPEEPAEGG